MNDQRDVIHKEEYKDKTDKMGKRGNERGAKARDYIHAGFLIPNVVAGFSPRSFYPPSRRSLSRMTVA